MNRKKNKGLRSILRQKDKSCPTCGRRSDGSSSSSNFVGLKKRKGRVRRRIRAATEFKIIPAHWYEGFRYNWETGEYDIPAKTWVKQRRVTTKYETVASIRQTKLKVVPSKGAPKYYNSKSYIKCVDKWHDKHPPKNYFEEEVVEPEKQYKTTKEHKIALSERSRAKYLEKRKRW